MRNGRSAPSLGKRPRDSEAPRGGRRDCVATLLNSLDDAANTPRSVCALVLYRKNTLGYAWLTGDDGGVVFCGQAQEDMVDPRAATSLLRCLPPPVALVLPAKFPAHVVDEIRRSADSRGSGAAPALSEDGVAQHPSDAADAPCVILSFLPTSEFTADGAFDALRVMWPERTFAQWSAVVDLGKPAVAMALSALLTVVNRRGTPIADIQAHSAGDLVRVSSETLHELHVFRTEEHPAAARGVGSAREGLSVYGLMNRCRTAEGRATLRRWFLLPTASPDVLGERLLTIGTLAHPAHREALNRVITLLRSIRSCDRLMDRIRSARHSGQDYKALVDTCQSALAIAHELHPLCCAPQPPPPLRHGDAHAPESGSASSGRVRFPAAFRYCCTLSGESLRQLCHLITTVVEYTSSDAGAIRVRDGVSTTIDGHRAACGSLDELLTHVAQQEAESLPADLSSLPINVVFFPQGGYVVHVQLPEATFETTVDNAHIDGFAGPNEILNGGRQSGDDDALFGEHSAAHDADDMFFNSAADAMGHAGLEPHQHQRRRDVGTASTPFAAPPQWELAFSTEGHLYYKTPRMKELDATVGDLHAAAVEAELEIVNQLDSRVLEFAPALRPLAILGEIDALCAMAATAIEESWCEPTFTGPDGTFDLRGCHHPLVSRTSSNGTVIPFDFSSTPLDAEAFDATTRRVTFVTGPNGSGKSVMLRAIAIAAYLAHIGSYVPCASARIPLLDFIAINDRCSVAVEQAFVRCASSSAATTSWGNAASATSKGTLVTAAPSRLVHSTFGHELAVVGRILRSWTSRSFVLLDEFGCGTLAGDGAALLAAVVHHAIQGGAHCPHLIIATHFTEALHDRIIPAQRIQWLAMKVTIHRALAATADGAHHAHQPRYEEMASRDEQFDAATAATDPNSNSRRPLDPAEVRILHRASVAGSPFSTRTPMIGLQRSLRENPAPADREIAGDADNEMVVPLFVTVPGSHATVHRNALSCARLCGMDEAILARAAAVLVRCVSAADNETC
jgi:DNA mismatch repair ATPase MutS